MKILFVISEVEDIIKTGGLADVGKALPIALKERGHEVSLVLPFYQQIEQNFKLVNAVKQQSFYINGLHYSYEVKELDFYGVKTYLVDHPYFSQANSPYADESMASNAQRFALLSLCALQLSAYLNFKPDIMHCNDWHTALTPYFMHSDYLLRNHLLEDASFFAETKSVITVHNAAFQGVESLDKVPLLTKDDYTHVFVDNHHVNMLKTGISYSTKVCPVSTTYAVEITSFIGSHGVSDVINHSPNKVVGVLNGCDYSQWDPSSDSHIPQTYSLDDFKGKAVCKKALQKYANLPAYKSTPIVGMVCRATNQKGFGYLLPILEEFLRHKVQLIIMGTGDKTITAELTRAAEKHPHKMAFFEAFDPKLAHLIEAGSDFFLMPSEFEPCGLNQMYSLAYGTIPIVRSVGGLADTVIDVTLDNSTGFKFYEPSAQALLTTLRNALLTYHETPSVISEMIERGMKTRFTWENAAKAYENLYLR